MKGIRIFFCFGLAVEVFFLCVGCYWQSVAIGSFFILAAWAYCELLNKLFEE